MLRRMRVGGAAAVLPILLSSCLSLLIPPRASHGYLSSIGKRKTSAVEINRDAQDRPGCCAGCVSALQRLSPLSCRYPAYPC